MTDQPAPYCNIETRFTAWLIHYNELMGINGPLSAEAKAKQIRWAWVDFVDNYLLVEAVSDGETTTNSVAGAGPKFNAG